MTTHKPILCLDFDGVCHSYTSGWVNERTIPDPPVAGLFPFLEAAFQYFRIAIYSSRSDSVNGRHAMENWFITHAREHYQQGVAPSSEWRAVADAIVAQLEFPISKPSAFVTLDDRAVTFTGTWPDVGMLRGFVTWNDHLIKKAPRNTVTENG